MEIILSYYIGIIIGIGLTVFTSLLFHKKNQIGQKNNLKVLKNYQKFLIRFQKVKDLHTFYTS